MENYGSVSIIIPVFNVRPYLVEALESVINQTYDRLEIIIIDDGSFDGSGELCDEYAKKDNRIRVIHQENKGLSVARNTGLDIMTGDLVAFIDPDDKYLPDYILNMLFAMQQHNADLVICRNIVQRTNSEMFFTGKEKVEPSIPQGLYDRISSLQARADGSINPNVWNKLYKQ